MVKHVTSVSQAAKRIRKILAEDKSLAKAYQRTPRILGEKKA